MKILFVCEGNMMRSPIAEKFYNLATDTHDATSAGAVATGADHIAPRMKEVMDEIDINTDELYSKQLTPEMVAGADKVVYFPSEYMPDYVKESPKSELWDVIDPHYHHEGGMELVRQVRDDIQQRVKKLAKETSDEN